MSLWGRVFAAIYDRMLAPSEEAGLADMRAALLAGAHGRVLELGAGTGLNLPHYAGLGDRVDELVLTEPEEPMARRLRERVATEGVDARVVLAGAEALPFEDASFDTVVCTLVLCTVDDPGATLAEVARVLKPGGRLLALEHVRSDDPARARSQDRWAPIWRRIGHGCRCNQDTGALLRAAPGFEVERLEATALPKASPITRPAISATARRADAAGSAAA